MVICLSKSTATERGLIVYEHWDDVSADFKVDDMRILSGSIDPWHITSIVMDHIESSGLCLPLEPGIGTCHDAGVDYKWKDVGWQHRGEQPRFAKLLFYSGEREHPDDYALVKGESVNRYYLDAGANWLIHDYQKYRTPQTTVLVYLALALVDLKVLTGRLPIEFRRLLTRRDLYQQNPFILRLFERRLCRSIPTCIVEQPADDLHLSITDRRNRQNIRAGKPLRSTSTSHPPHRLHHPRRNPRRAGRRGASDSPQPRSRPATSPRFWPSSPRNWPRSRSDPT